MSNHVALVTGGRIKIGFETAAWLLRCGAKVHLTTRFPADAAVRYLIEIRRVHNELGLTIDNCQQLSKLPDGLTQTSFAQLTNLPSFFFEEAER